MKISVILCTYNRAQLLDDTIASYFLMERASEAELIIVDNASTDTTRLVVERWQATYPNVRYEFEPEAGLSHARNHGIGHANGEIIAFVDDDVYFSATWLTELKKTFDDPEVACMGGKSIPLFEEGKPSWLTEAMFPIYGSTCSGDQSKRMQYPEHPFGLNMAFRKQVFCKVGLFNPQLGRKQGNLLSNEESELFWRIHCAGMKVIYNPNALIYHRISKERTTQKWVLRRYYWQGRSEAVLDRAIYRQSRLKMLSNLKDRLVYLLKSNCRYLSWSHPKKIYWQLAAMPLYEKSLWCSLIGYFQQALIEILWPRQAR